MKKLIILFAICLFTTDIALAQDVDKFINETQKTKADGEDMKIAWWIPVEFWMISLESEESLSKKAKEDMYDVLDDYFIIGIVDAEMGPFGGFTYTSEKELKKTMELKLDSKELKEPLSHRELDADMQVLLDTFKPILKNMLGDLGENFHFFVYKDTNKKGDRILDPYASGELVLICNDESYNWNLPLESLFPLKVCPEDKAELNGAWSYCPYHGTELIEAEKAISTKKR